jgi:D-serine deaminase-like pyridoxal phosphate-dependent protein
MLTSDLDTPAVLVDVNVMERNLQRLASYCAGHRICLRPHTKTHKIPELARKQIKYGATGITVAKLGEAEVMADSGLDDILIAFPLVGVEKCRRLIALAQRVNVTIALDSFYVASKISDAGAAVGVRIGILVEFDTGLGRCGLPIENKSVKTLHRIRELPGIEFKGVMFYPGHFLVGPFEREELLRQENRKLAGLLEEIKKAGISAPVVSGGGTPTAYMSHRFVGVNEIRAGTYIFNDMNTVGCEAASIEDCAVTVMTTVVSTSVSGKAIIDGGSKTFSSDRWLSGEQRGFGRVLEDPAIVFAAMSEEHGHFDLTNATRKFRVADRVRVIPNHVCATINMHDTIYGVDGDQVIAQWKVQGRGRVQ